MVDKDRDKFSGEYLKYTGVGFEIAGSVAFFCLLGYFFDRHFGTKPTGILIGALVGIIVGTYLLIKEALAINKINQKGKNGERKDEGNFR